MRWGAGAVSVLLGLGFGVPCVLGIRHFAQTGQVWSSWGSRHHRNLAGDPGQRLQVDVTVRFVKPDGAFAR